MLCHIPLPSSWEELICAKKACFFGCFFSTSFHFMFAENSGFLSAVWSKESNLWKLQVWWTLHGASWRPLGTLRCNKVFFICVVWCFKSSPYDTPQKWGISWIQLPSKMTSEKLTPCWICRQLVFFLGVIYAQRWLRNSPARFTWREMTRPVDEKTWTTHPPNPNHPKTSHGLTYL